MIAQVNRLGVDQPKLVTFYDQQNREIGDVDEVEPVEDNPAEEMPGAIGTNLPIQDNTGMVEDDIEITGVDDPVDQDYMEEPKIDLNVPPVNPILPENPEEPIDGTEPRYETAIKTFEHPAIEPIDKPTTVKKSKETAQQSKESTRQSSRTPKQVKRLVPSMKENCTSTQQLK